LFLCFVDNAVDVMVRIRTIELGALPNVFFSGRQSAIGADLKKFRRVKSGVHACACVCLCGCFGITSPTAKRVGNYEPDYLISFTHFQKQRPNWKKVNGPGGGILEISNSRAPEQPF
jgi:hypothetical protein